MGFSEFQLEEFIWNNISNDEIYKRGLHLPRGLFYRQMRFPSCGIPDLVCVGYWTQIRSGERKRVLSIDVIELKKGEVQGVDMLQLMRYMAYVWANIRTLQTNWDVPVEWDICQVTGHIVGNSFSRDAICVLTNCDTICGSEFSFDLEAGISFKGLITAPTWPHPDTFKDVTAHESVNYTSVAKTSEIVKRALRMKTKTVNIENPN